MSTQFTNRQWRLPNNENKDKQSNYSIQASSTNARINISSPANVGITSSFAFWLKRTSSTAITQPYRISTGGVLYGMYMNATTAIYVRYGGSPITINNTATLNALALTDWVHWVITREEVTSTTQDIKLYANGSLIYTLNGTSTLGTYDSEIDYLMWSLQTTDFMDSFSIFDYALSSSQITTLYGSSSTGIGNPMSLSPKPVAYYPLGDQDAFNGASYLTPNASLKDFVFDIQSSNSIDFQNGLLSNLSAFTVSFWYKRGAANATTATLIEQNGVISISQYRNSASYSGIEIILTTVDGQSTILTTNQGNVPVGEWLHVGIVYDGSNMTLYRNGSQSPGTYNPIAATGNTVNNSNIFEIVSQSSLQYEISNLAIFNTALPATGSNSVETLYNNGSPLTSMSGFSSLTNWYKLDASDTYDGTNWTIEDHAGSNDGTSSGMTQANLVQSDLSFTSGYSPYALDFDSASSDYIEVPNSTDFDFGTGGFTISAWVNTTGTPTEHGTVVSKQNPGISGQWTFQVLRDGRVSFYGNNGGIDVLSTTTIIDGNWHNIVIQRTGNIFNLYIDKVLEDQQTASNQNITNTQVLRIGRRLATYNAYFNGSISNVSVWNTGLTSTQVTEIYNEGVPSNLNNHSAYSNLVSWWQLGSNSSFNTNWTVLDEKGSNNGTSSNMGEDAIVDGVGSYANGLSSGMGGDEVIGDAPYSTANSLSVNMDVEDRVTDTPS